MKLVVLFLLGLIVGLTVAKFTIKRPRRGKYAAVTEKPNLLKSDNSHDGGYFYYEIDTDEGEEQQDETKQEQEEQVEGEGDGEMGGEEQIEQTTSSGDSKADDKQMPSDNKESARRTDPADFYKQGVAGQDQFGMLADLPNIPGLNISPELLMKLDPKVLEMLIASLSAGQGVGNPTADPNPPVNVVKEIDICPETVEHGIPYYCKDMPDGLYYDPWNPWCGYIRCEGGMPKRHTCKRFSWTGIKNKIGMGQKDLCQRPLTTNDDNRACPVSTDMYMCRNAEKIEQV